MEPKREQALVGLFVLIAAGILIATVFLLSGTFNRRDIPYHAYFKNAGGLGPGTEVRYAGGPPIGRVVKVAPDPRDAGRMLVEFSVHPEVPVKADSRVTITSTSALGDNFLGIIPGTNAAPRAPRDSALKSVEFTSIADVTAMIASLGPSANTLLVTLNERAVSLQETINRINDLLNDENRRHISSTLANLDGALAEDRPVLHSTLTNVNASSEKLSALIDSFKKTSAEANEALSHIDATLTENRPDIRQSIIHLRGSLASADSILSQLDTTTAANTENLDEIIDNLRHITENLNSFTETIKTRPYTLIRASGVKPHEPGQAPPK